MIDSNLKASTIYLRLVNEDDAEFICALRNTQSLNIFISKSTANVEEQKKWIINYKNKEKQNEEFYFIICKNEDDLPIGTVRLYDFKENPKSFVGEVGF